MRSSLVLVLSLLLVGDVLSDCYSNSGCSNCKKDKEDWWDPFGCRWCPLTRHCHAYGSVKNHCSSSHQVTKSNSRSCGDVEEPTVTYNYDPNQAEFLAKWSSLAYAKPGSKDKDSMINYVESEFGSNYRILEFLLKDCDMLLEYASCGVIIGISDVDNHLVVAYRGTMNSEQLVEQLLTAFAGMTSSGIGGEVMVYNKNAHNSLYPCVKSIVQEQVNSNSNLKVSVTGHSLGGASASLAAAHLVDDNVVSASKLEVYTFGAPRVGDRTFAFNYDKMVANSWRVTKKKDPVVQMVPHYLLSIFYGYHTKKEIFYNTNSDLTTSTSYKICTGNEDDGCIKGVSLCITTSCQNEHTNYFLADNGWTVVNMLSSGTPATKGSRDKCTSYIY